MHTLRQYHSRFAKAIDVVQRPVRQKAQDVQASRGDITQQVQELDLIKTSKNEAALPAFSTLAPRGKAF